MKNYKKLAAITMAATMLVSSGVTAFAEDDPNTGTDTGSGKYEGSVDETSAFTVDVPTNAANVFNFFVDPNGLLEETGYARFKDLSESKDNFEEDATLFFTRTVAGTVTKKYGKDSDSVTLTNMSSYEVDVEVTASIAGVDSITLAENAEDIGDAEDPTLYLAIVSGSQTEVITSDGATLTDTIDGKPDNYEIKWNSSDGKYEYGLTEDATTDDPDDTDSAWEKLSFNLTGACGGKWTDEQAEVAPVVTLTWKITDPNAEAAPSIATTEYSYDRTTTIPITASLGGGSLAATAITKVEGSTDGRTVALDLTSACGISGNTFTLPSNQFAGAKVGEKRYLIVTFNDDEGTKVVLTLNITK